MSNKGPNVTLISKADLIERLRELDNQYTKSEFQDLKLLSTLVKPTNPDEIAELLLFQARVKERKEIERQLKAYETEQKTEKNYKCIIF